jgi:hypothetical protein
MRPRASVTKDDKINWHMTLSQLCRDISDHERIINFDESCWQVHQDDLPTWVATAAQNIRLYITGNEQTRLLSPP